MGEAIFLAPSLGSVGPCEEFNFLEMCSPVSKYRPRKYGMGPAVGEWVELKSLKVLSCCWKVIEDFYKDRKDFCGSKVS
ncbi:unnamed protein product [Larinioides sclopetarius]|uniref:Uncharacterized protein n=1 Tax=Larinioides sclopetarius TaxID=280406 RepID=A0AAV1Z5W1_9ARAC